MKKTVVLGASTNPTRYSYLVTNRLNELGHEVIPFGIKQGKIGELEIVNEWKSFKEVDTVTLYLNPALQKGYYDRILALKPNRIIFNPGTENVELISLAKEQGIEVEIACSLVMLSTGEY